MKKKIMVTVIAVVLALQLGGCKQLGEEASSQNSSSVLSNPSSNAEMSSAESVSSAQEVSSEPAVSSEALESLISQIENSTSVVSQPTQTVLTPQYTDLAKLDSKKNGWGQGTRVDEKNRPISCVGYQEKYGKYGAVFIKEDTKDFYLTFDEGYENGYTPKILDVLKQKQAPAVFFVTKDYVKRNPGLVKRMIEEGHVVGNHSWSHPSMPTLTLEDATKEITQLHDYVKEEFGYEMTLFRPPMGEYSEQTLALTQQLGYQSVFWSYAYKDWDPNNQPDQAASLEKALKYAHGGAVYLLHAVSSTNTNMLGDFIDGIRQKGYELKALQ